MATTTEKTGRNRSNKLQGPDIYARVTSQIEAALESGVRPWIKPWIVKHAAGRVSRPLRHRASPTRGATASYFGRQESTRVSPTPPPAASSPPQRCGVLSPTQVRSAAALLRAIDSVSLRGPLKSSALLANRCGVVAGHHDIMMSC